MSVIWVQTLNVLDAKPWSQIIFTRVNEGILPWFCLTKNQLVLLLFVLKTMFDLSSSKMYHVKVQNVLNAKPWSKIKWYLPVLYKLW